MTLEEISEIANAIEEKSSINRGFEVCYVGLLSYFEAFCKDHFASILNIAPQLFLELRSRNFDLSIDASRAVMFEEKLPFRFGTLFVEKLDFGSSKSINSYFTSLLKITPLSQKESEQFERFLFDRHLLVHHGGAITSKYAEQIKVNGPIKEKVFWDSIVITKARLGELTTFVDSLSRKISKASHDALLAYVAKNGIKLTAEGKKAVHSFLWLD